MQKIAIINYGMGNLQSIKKSLSNFIIDIKITDDPKVIKDADKYILPGVGHFEKAMSNIQEMGILNTLNNEVIINKKPVLGICLGMQLFAEFSEEGSSTGLGWIKGRVLKFDTKDKLKFKVPHIGWNKIKIEKSSQLMRNIGEESEFYFVHSYYFDAANKVDILNSTTYEDSFSSGVEKENIFGVQYHPEKSHSTGRELLQNFINV